MNTITGEPRYKSEFRVDAYQAANRRNGSQMPAPSDVQSQSAISMRVPSPKKGSNKKPLAVWDAMVLAD